MNICIVGLGLIGGSLAKAISARTSHICLGIDADEQSCSQAKKCGAVKEIITPMQLSKADVVILALPPQAITDFFCNNVKYIKSGTLVFDTCGVKQKIIKSVLPVAKQYDIKFVGAHPMAGREFSGFEYSLETLFDKASFIAVTDGAEQSAVDKVCALAKEIGFASIKVTTAEHHDRVIAYTSQLAHVVSNAYCKSGTISERDGFCAGSFADMTRVGKLDVKLWTQLFLANTAALNDELSNLINKLNEFKTAIAANDKEQLAKLLQEGNDIKVKSLQEENK